MATFQVRIDRDECTMCSVCWEMCPEFFEASPEDNMSQVIETYRIDGDISKGEVPDALTESVREAAESCPVQIIHVEELAS